MKLSLALMAVILAAALGLVWSRGQLAEAMRASWTQAGQFLPIVLIAIVVIGCTEVLLSKELVERWLSDSSGMRGILIGWFAGALTPGGSLVGLPLVAGLYRAGVGAAVLVTYLVSLALLSMIRIPMEIGLIGARLTAVRVLVCLLLPPLAGLLTRVVTLAVRP